MWTSTNYQRFQPHFLLKPKTTQLYNRNEGDVLNLPNELIKNLFKTAQKSYIAFGGYKDDKNLFIFSIISSHFYKFDHRRSRILFHDLDVPNQKQHYKMFLLFMFLHLLQEQHITHFKWNYPKKQYFNLLCDALAFTANGTHTFPFLLVNGSSFINLLSERPPPKCKNFIAYHDLKMLESRIFEGNEDRSYHRYKRDVDLLLESYSIIQDNIFEKNLETIEQELALTDAYEKMFRATSQIKLHTVFLMKIINDISKKNITAEKRQEIADAIITNQSDLFLYFAQNFNSKYKFLFAKSQLWRLQHWNYLLAPFE